MKKRDNTTDPVHIKNISTKQLQTKILPVLLSPLPSLARLPKLLLE